MRKAITRTVIVHYGSGTSGRRLLGHGGRRRHGVPNNTEAEIRAAPKAVNYFTAVKAIVHAVVQGCII